MQLQITLYGPHPVLYLIYETSQKKKPHIVKTTEMKQSKGLSGDLKQEHR